MARHTTHPHSGAAGVICLWLRSVELKAKAVHEGNECLCVCGVDLPFVCWGTVGLCYPSPLSRSLVCPLGSNYPEGLECSASSSRWQPFDWG